MEKSILISIQPQYLANILNGDKTLELRKSVPKDYKGWVYIYCTKSSKNILYKYKGKYYTQHYLTFTDSVEVLNGEVIGKFWFDEYEKINLEFITNSSIVYEYRSEKLSNYDLISKTCLQEHEIVVYLKAESGYVWYIKQLEIFDTPLSVNDFYNPNLWLTYEQIKEYEKETNDFIGCRIKKAPQSWRYVYKGE